MTVAAIIPAAGLGVRMKTGTPKPYLLLHDKPLLAHTLRAFEISPEVSQVAVVVHPEDLDHCQTQVIDPFQFKKVLRLIPGGKERQDSVYQGLKVLRQKEDLEIVLVHDGVRPFISPDHIRQVIQAARRSGAAVLGLPATDTLKRLNPKREVVETINRQEIWHIQTPQAFHPDLLWRAFVSAYSRNFYGTDEAMLVEQLPHPVVVIPGSPFNLKITTPEDLRLAEALLLLLEKQNHADRFRL